MLPQIVALNVADQPFSFYAEGNRIVGWWDIAKISTLYPDQANQADQTYRLTVTLDEARGTFDYNETRQSATWGTGYNEDGFRSIGKAHSSGKRIEKGFSFTLGRARDEQDTPNDSQPTGPAAYRFKEDQIKRPLFEWLQQHGWSHQDAIGRFFAP